jgi:hypothetical protein
MLALALGPTFRARAQSNLALGKPAFASWNNPVSGNGTDMTAYATDNLYNTEWNNTGSASKPNDKLGVDLGSVKPFRYLRINWGAARATAFTVEVADDVDLDPNSFTYGESLSWTTVYTRDENADPQVNAPANTGNDVIDLWKDGNLTSLSHRVIRINATASSDTTNLTFNITELGVYATLPSVSGVAKTSAGTGIPDTLFELVGPAAVAGGPPSSTQKVKSSANGAYAFTGLYDGTYTLLGIPMGKFAPVTTTVTLAGANVTQDVTFATPVLNTIANTAPLPGFSYDNIAAAGESKGGNFTSGGLALPVDELPLQPAGAAVWTTGDPNAFRAPGTDEVFGPGALLPAGLHFYLPPYGTGLNNVVFAENVTVPVPAAHYTALYILQSGADGAFNLPATLTYSDGSTQRVTTVAGSTTYTFTDGPNGAGDDEIDAVLMDKRYTTADGVAQKETSSYRIHLHWIVADSTKILSSVSFGAGSGNGTTAKAALYGWSGDTLETPPAVGTIHGTIKSPTGAPVKNANVTVLGDYRLTTDATGVYSYSGLPTGSYVITANKPANYPVTSVTVSLPAGGNVTQDIQFPNPIPVITDALTSPNLDEVSNDDPAATATNPGLYADFSATSYGFGSEFMPKGRWNPTMGNPAADPDHHNGRSVPNWEAAAGAPEALTFDFGDPTLSSPVPPGYDGYPQGGVPNMACLHDFEILAPQTRVQNAYMAVTGLDGAINMTVTLNYVDGTSEVKTVNVSDWYGSPSSNELPYVVMHGRHTFDTGKTPPWEDGVGDTTHAPANIFIKALVIPCNSNKVLHDITFDHGDQTNLYPIVSAISWETVDTPQASSDVRVTVKTNGGAAAAGAWVAWGPYSAKADASGIAVFKGVAAGTSMDITAFLYGVTKAGVAAAHIVPAGMKLPSPDEVTITLPADAPIFVYLPLAYDFDMISMSDNAGDYKGAADNDSGFNGDLMPPSDALIPTNLTNNGHLWMPRKEMFYDNVQRMNNQVWNVVPGHYSNLSFLVTGQGVGNWPYSRYSHVTLYYADGTSEQIQVANRDWVGNYTGGNTSTNGNNAGQRGAFYRELPAVPAPDPQTIGLNIRSRRNGGSDENGSNRPVDSTAAFIQVLVPVNGAKKLTKIVWPPQLTSGASDWNQNDFSILAATLEAIDMDASATITGRVVGQPLGAAAAGGIKRAKVIADDAHMAFTNADGTFTLTQVPVGTTSLKVIPLGTGILTKTFPVTIAAGANAVGDLTMNNPQRYIYAVLGASNAENGLHLISGTPTPYAKDGNRPSNRTNRPIAGTSPITIGGKTARQNRVSNSDPASDHYYFSVDPGWLWHGIMGDPGTLPIVSADGTSVITPGTPGTGPGLDLSTFVVAPAAPTTGAWKLAPKVYMFIEYFDNARSGQTDDVFYLAYNKLEPWVHNSAASSWNIPGGGVGSAVGTRMTNDESTVRIKNAAGTGTDQLNVVKGSTNTWKWFTYELNPVQNSNPVANNLAYDAFGCYASNQGGGDFKLDSWYKTNDNPDVIRTVIISLDPTMPTLPATPSAKDALRISAGLTAATSELMGVDNVNGDGKVTIQDAITLAKQGLL